MTPPVGYTEMKDSGVPWLGEIPSHWVLGKVKNQFVSGKDVVGNDVDNYERLALTLNGVIKRSKNDGTGLQPEKFETYQILRENELVFKLIDLQNVSTSRVGRSPYTGIVSPAYIILHDKKNRSTKYAEYYFLSMWMHQVFNQLGADGVRSNIGTSTLLNLPFLLVPDAEQSTIAAYLDTQCAKIDDIIAEAKASIEEYKQWKAAVIYEAVTKGLNPDVEMKDSGIEWVGMIPVSWNMIKGKHLFQQRNMRGNDIELQLLSPTQKYGVIPQYLYEELTGMRAVKLNEQADLASLKTIHKGDFCISLRSFQGGFEYSEYEGVVSPAYQVFYPTAKIADGYYKYLFKDSSFISKMNSYTMTLRDGKNIAFSDFGNTLIPCPPVREQLTIAAYLDSKCAQIAELITEKDSLISDLEAYKKSLIYEVVTGKREVQ